MVSYLGLWWEDWQRVLFIVITEQLDCWGSGAWHICKVVKWLAKSRIRGPRGLVPNWLLCSWSPGILQVHHCWFKLGRALNLHLEWSIWSSSFDSSSSVMVPLWIRCRYCWRNVGFTHIMSLCSTIWNPFTSNMVDWGSQATWWCDCWWAWCFCAFN
jgi:hypothetical protein